MADFSFLSESDDENAVEELLSQAKDHVVLEQLAAINRSGFTDSALPTQLETRFQKLKSLPNSIPKSSSSLHNHSASFFSSSNLPSVVISPKKQPKNRPFESKTASTNKTELNSGSDSEKNYGLSPLKMDVFSPSKRNPDGKIAKTPKSQLQCSSFEVKTETNSGSDSDKHSVERQSFSHAKLSKDDIFSPSNESSGAKIAKTTKSQLKCPPFKAKAESNSVSDSDKNSVQKRSLPHSKLFQNDIFSPTKKNADRKMAKESSKSPCGSSSSKKSSIKSTTSSTTSQKSGFFWWLPRRASSSKKMSKENKRLGMGIDWEMEDELLSSDFKTFSAIKQKELLKKAMKVEEKINREAEKIAKWSKQVSAKS